MNVIEFPQKSEVDKQFERIESQSRQIELQRQMIQDSIDQRDFKAKQQDLTELNGDGNRDRGRYGEDES
mgnify:CR=1 FL=1|tara:strand:+ start:398 stop:604 length:207 start_codon:yes stop_codon:yes gene_type:complete